MSPIIYCGLPRGMTVNLWKDTTGYTIGKEEQSVRMLTNGVRLIPK